jgi:hypothetical protein
MELSVASNFSSADRSSLYKTTKETTIKKVSKNKNKAKQSKASKHLYYLS